MSFNPMKDLRSYANGVIDESALDENIATQSTSGSDFSDAFYGLDADFIQECIADAIPIVTSAEIMDEDAEYIESVVNDAVHRLSDYFMAQGLINEAPTVPTINKKLNVVHLNKEAQIKRLTKIFTLKLARHKGTTQYKKYKIGTNLRKTNMEAMTKQFGSQAERMAKQTYAKLKNHPKSAVVISDQRQKISNNSAKKKKKK